MKAKDIIEVFDFLSCGLEDNGLLQQSDCYLFNKDSVWSFNDEVSVGLDFTTDITGAVISKIIYPLISKLNPDSDVELSADPKKMKFFVKSGLKEAWFRYEPKIIIPVWNELFQPEEWYPLDEAFVKAVDFCSFSADKNDIQFPILNCVHITEEFVETCDQRRCTKVSVGLPEIKKFNIPTNEINIRANTIPFSKYNFKYYGFSDSRLWFKNDKGTICSARIFEEKYPEIASYFIVDNAHSIVLPPEISKAIEWCKLLADDTIKVDQKIRITLSSNEMLLRGSNMDGEAFEKIPVAWEYPTLDFCGHPDLIIEMVKKNAQVIVGKETLRIDCDNMIHVVSLETTE